MLGKLFIQLKIQAFLLASLGSLFEWQIIFQAGQEYHASKGKLSASYNQILSYCWSELDSLWNRFYGSDGWFKIGPFLPLLFHKPATFIWSTVFLNSLKKNLPIQTENLERREFSIVWKVYSTYPAPVNKKPLVQLTAGRYFASFLKTF